MNYFEFLQFHENTYHTPPIEMLPIVEKLDLELTGSNILSGYISGKIYKRENNKYRIVVNINHPQTRQRFTIAHEIAHYILHKNLIGDGIIDDELYRSLLSDEIEKEANNFAADILMPARLLFKSIQKHKDNIPKLAKLYRVSEVAMSIRLGYKT